MKAANELDVKEIITKLKGKELKPKTNSIKYTQVRWSQCEDILGFAALNCKVVPTFVTWFIMT